MSSTTSESISVAHPTGIVKATINLPASKSISNRLLIINKLSGNPHPIENLSSSSDTLTLKAILELENETADVNDAGTSMRFLTAYYCALNQDKIVTGSERMQERPIGELVNALRAIGFKIEYQKKDGFPPIKIFHQPELKLKNTVELDASISSQYISALLMIAPSLPEGLTIVLKTKPVSEPYIAMTLSLMKQYGINYSVEENNIKVPPQKYTHLKSKAEADWSAASYWYIIAALSKEAEIKLPGLMENSLQGDKQIAEWSESFGVTTTFNDEVAVLIKHNDKSNIRNYFTIDFVRTPDLAQSVFVMAAFWNVTLELTGIQTLKVKETDRIEAMRTELKKMNADLREVSKNNYRLYPDFKILNNTFDTYKDHRMAMAFAPLGLVEKVTIKNPKVVSKSYPEFWEHLQKAGFAIEKSTTAE